MKKRVALSIEEKQLKELRDKAKEANLTLSQFMTKAALQVGTHWMFEKTTQIKLMEK